MFCPKCGKDIRDDSAFCPFCGAQVAMPVQQQQVRTNAVAIVGFLLAFLFPPAGFICSIIGAVHAKNCGGSGKGLAIAGVIVSVLISSLSFMLGFIILLRLQVVI